MDSTTITLKCKLSGTDDLRRRTVTVSDGFGISHLRDTVTELFQLDVGATYTILWRDEDEDLVTVDSDPDVHEAMRCAAETSGSRPTLRLEVRIDSPTTTNTNDTAPSNTTAPAPCPVPDFVRQLTEQLPGQLKTNIDHLAREFEKHAPALEKHAQEMAKQFEKHAKDFHEKMPPEFKHKAHGLCKFLKKAKKNKKLHMKFVADTSLPDGTEVHPGDMINKSWQVVNSGQEVWPENSRLQHVGSDIFEGTVASGVPCLQPGEETELSLNNMVTPSEPGRYMSYWRLSTAEGNKFGDRLWYDVTVKHPDGSDIEPEAVIHLNVCCDVTGMHPIVGNRYKKFGFDYDLCQEAFDNLSEEEKCAFRLIATPEDAAEVHGEEANVALTRWADEAFQLRGEQSDYDRVMESDDHQAEFDAIRDEIEDAIAQEARLAHEAATQGQPIPEYPYAPVPKEVAYGFLAALKREYVENIDSAVGEYFEHATCGLSADELDEHLEGAFEQRVRDAEDAMMEIQRIGAEWIGAGDAAVAVHEGIWCDVTGMHPILGNRYCKQLPDDTYDLCQEAFDNLSEEDKCGFQLIATPEDAAEVLRALREKKPTEPAAEEEPAEPAGEEEYEGAVEEEPAAEPAAEEAVFDTTDLTESCMADIEETFKQLSEAEHQEAEAEAARLIAQAEAAAEAEAAAKAAEEAAAAKAAEEAAAAKAAEEAAAAKAAEEAAAAAKAAEKEAVTQDTVPLEWQGVSSALVNMGFSSSLADDVTMGAQGNFDQALEAALSYVPPPPPPPPAAALVKSTQQDAWEDEWDCLVDELVEMGFEDVDANKKKVAEHKGDLKSTVTALISEERSKRSSDQV